ncbi:MAG: protein kinase [Verrucomicrobiae bacterium]|nr:protein kinase [Verrucomicrobiae bacterium]
MTGASSHCSRCRSPLGRDVGDGVCAACLLEEALPAAEGYGEPASEHTLAADVSLVQHFGPYELLEEVGRGGMGVIYKARQPGLDRVVALKMLLAGEFADARARERLLREAKIAARLTHPHIVTIHEVGEHQGRPYFAMEYVPGRNLAQHCRDGLLPVATAVRYVEQLARAVHYAHQHGVIHRDLKPANILISPDDEPKLTDFGLTKSLVDPTQTIESAGSPNFMAPEQADSTLGTTGTPTDIYGLGAILYYLLTGRPPAVGETLSETLRAVVTGEPVAPRQLRPALPRDLETITLKCLEKEPARRYGSALEVADDLTRWQRHETIHARPSTGAERLAKWVRRRPAVAALSAACLLAVILGFAAVTWQWRRAEAQAEATARANYAATLGVVRQRLDEGVYRAARQQLYALPERFRGWEWGRLLNLAHREILDATVLTHGGGGPPDRVPSPIHSFGLNVSPDHRWVACWGSGRLEILDLTNGESVFQDGSAENRVAFAGFSPSGDRLAAAGPGPGYTLWSSGDWRVIRRWDTQRERPRSICFSPDGRQIATADGSRQVRLYDGATGAELRQFEGSLAAYEGVSFTPDGSKLVGNIRPRDGGQRFTIWDVKIGRVEAEVPWTAAGLRSVELTADASRYATVDTQGVTAVWRVGRDHPEFETPAEGDQIVWAAVALDQPRLVTVRVPSLQAKFLDLESGKALPISVAPFNFMRVGSDGRTLLSCGNALVHRWDWKTGRPAEALGIGDVAIQSLVDVSPDGRLVGALIDHFPTPSTLHVWPVQPTDRRLAPPNTAMRSALAPDGETVALGHLDSRISLWSTRTGERIAWLHGHYRQVNDVVWASDGRTLFSASGDHTVRRWNVPERRLEATFTNLTRPVWSLSLTPDGRRVAAVDLSGRVAVWDGKSGALIRSWDIPRENNLLPVQLACLNPQGSEVVLTGFSAAGVWSVDTGQLLRRFTPPGEGGDFDPCSAAFSPDGKRLATVDRSGRLRLWDTRQWTQLAADEAGEGASHLTFSQDGRRLFLTTCQALSPGMGEVSVEIHDGETGAPLLSLGRQRGWGTSIAAFPDGRRLLHTVMDNDSPTHGTDVLEALPWTDRGFPGGLGEALGERVTRLARARHWERLRAAVVIPENPGKVPPEPRSNWRVRDPATPAECVDLTASYNGHLETGWLPDVFLDGYGNDLASLPRGVVPLNGVTWDIRGVVSTGQPERSPLFPWPFGRTVPDLPVQGFARRLHFLHASADSPGGGGRIGRYRLHFAGGTTADLTLDLGEDIGEWWSGHPQSVCRQGRVAWEGENPASARRGSKVRLFHRAWDNPHPDREIVSLELIGEGAVATIFVVAITVER